VPPSGHLQSVVLRHVDKTVANTGALASELVGEVGLPLDRLLAQHQGVDLERSRSFCYPVTKARTRLRLPLDKRLVVYTGKIYVGYEEVELVLQAARLLEKRRDVELFSSAGGMTMSNGCKIAFAPREDRTSDTSGSYRPPQCGTTTLQRMC
jgi:hypothetical protein